MRAILLLVTATLGQIAIADEYSIATIVDAGQSTELYADGFGGVQGANENTLTVDIDGMRITASYATILASGKNAASNFIVGSEVQARVHRNNKWLYIVREDGKELRARITRRAIVD